MHHHRRFMFFSAQRWADGVAIHVAVRCHAGARIVSNAMLRDGLQRVHRVAVITDAHADTGIVGGYAGALADFLQRYGDGNLPTAIGMAAIVIHRA